MMELKKIMTLVAEAHCINAEIIELSLLHNVKGRMSYNPTVVLFAILLIRVHTHVRLS